MILDFNDYVNENDYFKSVENTLLDDIIKVLDKLSKVNISLCKNFIMLLEEKYSYISDKLYEISEYYNIYKFVMSKDVDGFITEHDMKSFLDYVIVYCKWETSYFIINMLENLDDGFFDNGVFFDFQIYKEKLNDMMK